MFIFKDVDRVGLPHYFGDSVGTTQGIGWDRVVGEQAYTQP